MEKGLLWQTKLSQAFIFKSLEMNFEMSKVYTIRLQNYTD